MQRFDLPVHRNPLRTRDHVEQALLQLLAPVERQLTEGCAGLHLGDFGAHYGENAARVEAFSRMLWGLGPLWSRGGGGALLPCFREGLVNGTDPEHPAYWGEVFDYDQKIVEMAAIVLALALNYDRLALNEREARNLHAWLASVNGRAVPKNNWLFFRVLVNAVFRLVGWAYDQKQMDEDLKELDSYYLGGGWYFDGRPGQIDYYIPFGMHYYGLLYAGLMGELDPERSRIFKERAAEFAGDFLYWFEDGGRAIPYGRSLTYRFGQCAFFSALAFAGVEALPWGVMKSRVLGNLRDWFSQPILHADGLLSVGYAYPNLCASENYNAPGSPYWGCKAFLCLALPADHPFWTAEEEVPKLEPTRCFPRAGMLFARDSRQVQLFPAAGWCANQLGQVAAKYEKLVYSSRMGFSVSRGDSLEEGAFDSCLAVSEAGEERWRMQRGLLESETAEDHIWRRFSPLRGVTVEVTVTPSLPGHRREYVITTDRPIDAADGGFAIPSEWEGKPYSEDMVEWGDHGLLARFPWGISGIRCESGVGEPVLVKAFPNTNLLYPNTRIPTVRFRLGAGTHRIVTAVTGEMTRG